MVLTGALQLKVENREKLRGISGKIIASNHNSILDVVMLISLIPNADCIVKNTLSKRHILQIITSKIYIPNLLDFSELSERVGKSLREGNNVIIFPEGSRVSAGQPSIFKKGAARLSIDHACNIVPVLFAGNEKIGLRKGDKMLSFHPTEKYDFRLRVLPEINVEEYKNESARVATERLTDDLKGVLTRL
jgi:1-acyl-sn-glycerol-3-phosphate acyltransferase